MAENERQEMEVDEVIFGTQLSSNEVDGGFVMCEVEEQQAARVEVPGPKRRVIRVESKKRKTMSVKVLLMKASIRKKQMRLASCRVR